MPQPESHSMWTLDSRSSSFIASCFGVLPSEAEVTCIGHHLCPIFRNRHGRMKFECHSPGDANKRRCRDGTRRVLQWSWSADKRCDHCSMTCPRYCYESDCSSSLNRPWARTIVAVSVLCPIFRILSLVSWRRPRQRSAHDLTSQSPRR